MKKRITILHIVFISLLLIGAGCSRTGKNDTANVNKNQAYNAQQLSANSPKLSIVDSIHTSDREVVENARKQSSVAEISFVRKAINTFVAEVNDLPRQHDKVYIEYQQTGVSQNSSLAYNLNDELAQGGYLIEKSSDRNIKLIEIPSYQLKQGKNKIRFSVPEEIELGNTVSNLRLIIVHDQNEEDTQGLHLHIPEATAYQN